jgi:hypothetical protein
MSLIPLNESLPSLFDGHGLAPAVPCPAPVVKSARSRNRAAGWQAGIAQAANYLCSQVKTEEERAQVEKLYEQAIEAGPDFLHYRGKSAFQEAPKLGIDRNTYARILYALDLIERGIYRNCRDKGKQGIPRTAARVLKTLLGLALKYGRVFPSLLGIAHLTCVCKQTVVNCLKLLEQYGFITIQRRIKRIRTPLGSKVVQDSNAYTIQEPTGLGALAVNLFKPRSESKICSPLPQKVFNSNIATPLDPDNQVALALERYKRAMNGRKTASS